MLKKNFYLLVVLTSPLLFVSAQADLNQMDVSQLEKNEAGIAIISPDQVSTENDLLVYIDNLKLENTNLGNITARTGSDGAVTIAVNYKHPGKFLGLVNSGYESISTVNSTTSGIPTVDSRPSFWSGLMTGKQIDYPKTVSTLIANESIVKFTQPNAPPGAKAKVVEQMVFELNKLFLS